ncbi:polysaccharide deacetylase family protein [Candidatus Methylomirabilis limnetica]|nr:polysaccharide deacetylase family protein [Candidatus Methylomirabilis limnetica]
MNIQHKHFLTFDVEHWYEGYRYRGMSGWEGIAPRDHIIVERLFDSLGKHNQKATFFFTGRFAKDFPGLVRRCAELGHEVASHSYEHRVIRRIASREEFRQDLRDSLNILADLCGKPILGYRATKWSVTPDNQEWVMSILAEEGLSYDSSFFPTFGADELRRNGRPLLIDLPGGRQILEIPASGLNFGPLCVPVAGGLYFRAFPAWITLAMLKQKERQGLCGMLCVHPYDLDLDSPNIAGGGILFRLFRAYGVAQAWGRLDRLLSLKKFTSIADWIQSAPSDLCRINYRDVKND